MRADLHTHSTRSDGTDSPTELVHKAAAAGLDVVGLADHDSFAGLGEAASAADVVGIRLLPSIEISCKFAGESVHMLGYGVTPRPALDAELDRVRSSRTDRLPEMLRRLAEAGMPLTADEVRWWGRHSPALGRPHVADAMVARGYVKDRDEAFRDWLADGQPIHVERYSTEVLVALRLVAESGGRAVLAHPWARRARTVLTADVLAGFASVGLAGIEVDHPDHDPQTRRELRGLASDLGLLVTGSSDYHGWGKVGHDLGCETTAPEVVEVLASPRWESPGASS